MGQYLLPTGMLNYIRTEITNSLTTLRHDKVQTIRALVRSCPKFKMKKPSTTRHIHIAISWLLLCACAHPPGAKCLGAV